MLIIILIVLMHFISGLFVWKDLCFPFGFHKHPLTIQSLLKWLNEPMEGGERRGKKGFHWIKTNGPISYTHHHSHHLQQPLWSHSSPAPPRQPPRLSLWLRQLVRQSQRLLGSSSTGGHFSGCKRRRRWASTELTASVCNTVQLRHKPWLHMLMDPQTKITML